jgi:hypothetical protein
MKPGRVESSWRRIAPYTALSLACFLCAVGLLFLMLFQAERLHALGLIGPFYYIVLLPLGLAVAGFLFGVLRSFARYSGKQFGGKLELGGPIIAAGLGVCGGFWLAKPSEGSFDVTVFVHGPGGVHDLILRNTGTVWMTLGADRRQEKIGDKGQADFKGIPSVYRAQQIPVSIDADGIEPVEPLPKYRLDAPALSIAVRWKAQQLSGRILRASDGQPVSNATVRIGDLRGVADADGHFMLTLPGASACAGLTLEVTAPGCRPWQERVSPGANEITAMLQPSS